VFGKLEKKRKKKEENYSPPYLLGPKAAPARVGRPAPQRPSSRVQQPSPPSRAFSPYFADRWGQVVSRLPPIVLEPDSEQEDHHRSGNGFFGISYPITVN
jgi:hypothetical protein